MAMQNDPGSEDNVGGGGVTSPTTTFVEKAKANRLFVVLAVVVGLVLLAVLL